MCNCSLASAVDVATSNLGNKIAVTHKKLGLLSGRKGQQAEFDLNIQKTPGGACSTHIKRRTSTTRKIRIMQQFSVLFIIAAYFNVCYNITNNV